MSVEQKLLPKDSTVRKWDVERSGSPRYLWRNGLWGRPVKWAKYRDVSHRAKISIYMEEFMLTRSQKKLVSYFRMANKC